MPIFELSSPKTGQSYRVEFGRDPTDEDVDEAISQFDTEFFQQQGLDPSIVEQGPVGTVVNAVRDVGPGLVGGLMQAGGRVLDAAAEGVAQMTGTQRGGFFADVADVGTRLVEAGQELRPQNPANPTAQTIGSGLQQAIGLVGTMGAAAPMLGTRAALTTVPVAVGGVLGAGEGVQTARDLGIESPAGQLATGAGFAAAEMLTEKLGGVGGKQVAEAIQGGLRQGLKQAGKTVLSEAVEEPLSGTAQEVITRTAGSFVEDPNRPGFTTTGAALPTMEGFAGRRVQEAIGGAAGGLVFGGLQLATNGQATQAPTNDTLPTSEAPAEDLGDLTAKDVADLEQTNQPIQTATRQPLQPILTNVPDGVGQMVSNPTEVRQPEAPASPASTVNDSLTVQPPETFQSGPGITDAESGSSASSVPAPAAEVAPVQPEPIVPSGSVSVQTPAESAGAPADVGAGMVRGDVGAERLRAEVAALPEQARARWTPEVMTAAESYLKTGDESSLVGMTPIQKRKVIQTRLETNPEALRAQEQADKAQEKRLTRQEQKDRDFESRTTFKNFKVVPGLSESGFVQTEVLAEARALVLDGITDLARWSRAMVARFGQKIRAFLSGIWDQVQGALPTDAAKNVRLGAKAKAEPVRVAATGAVDVMGPREVRETRARFARPEEQDRLYETREDVMVKASALAWLDSVSTLQAIEALEQGRLPEGMTGDVAQHAAGLLIQRTTEGMKVAKDELARMQARALAERMSRVWQGWLSQEAGRNLRQRSVVNAELVPYAPVLAAEGLLIDRAEALVKERFDGGAAGVAEKVNGVADVAGTEASTETAADVTSTEPAPAGETPAAKALREQRAARAKAKAPNLMRMLNALRKKIAPGMSWADIFMDLPGTQKARQREIYRRLMLDERLKALTADERLGLTNELDKLWQQRRREVFQRELRKAGVMGEKSAADRAKVEKALPKLIRLINLGMMNSEMFREAIAPEYGLKTLTLEQSLKLRDLAEEAYKMPEGVLRSRKLAALLDGIQRSTGTSRAEMLNHYWTAAVLSGLRTQFDTFMSVTNGFGNQLIQSGMLALTRGKRAEAIVSMMEWWRGIGEAFPEAMRIVTKGDYSYLKRFNADLKLALNGESTFRPVPLGEALWRDGNAIEKYGFAPIMIWTGRLMAAADHLNNSATTRGARAVARALHPELYKGAVPTELEQAAALKQAKREVLGDEAGVPKTKEEMLTVKRRKQEILAGLLTPEQQQEASFMGDQAAYQNDPVGVFGGIYSGMNAGLGMIERQLQAGADRLGLDGPAGHYARAAMLFLSGSIRAMMGAKFIRFGANFGNDMLGYVPGTALLGPAITGFDATRSQKQLLMGKNVVGLMAGLTVAAFFLGKDDEEEGWHLEGPWNDLLPEEIKQRRAAGFEPLTLWKRGTGGKMDRVSYKQWPTAGLLASVAHMNDRRRFRPQKWEQEGMAGHLLSGLSVGAFQVKNVAALEKLANLLAASKFGANPEDDFVKRLNRGMSDFAGGFIPTLAKDLDALQDPQRYKPEGVYEEFLRNVPLVRRRVAQGRPEINILGVPVEQDRKPWSRAYTEAEAGPAHVMLAKLMARGLMLSPPDTSKKVWDKSKQAWNTVEGLGAEAEWRYQKRVGDKYRAWLMTPDAQQVLTLPPDQAETVLNRWTDSMKRQVIGELFAK